MNISQQNFNTTYSNPTFQSKNIVNTITGEYLRRKIADGFTMTQIASELGCSCVTIKRAAKNNGISFPRILGRFKKIIINDDDLLMVSYRDLKPADCGVKNTCSNVTVGKRRKEAGMPYIISKTQSKMPSPQEIAAYIASGGLLKDLYKILGIPRTSFYRQLKKANYPLTERIIKRCNRKLLLQNPEFLADLKTMSTADVAKKYNYSKSNIRKIKRELRTV